MFALLLWFQQLLCAGHKQEKHIQIIFCGSITLYTGLEMHIITEMWAFTYIYYTVVWRIYQHWQHFLHYLGQSQIHQFAFCRLLGNQFESSVKHNVKFIVIWRNPRLHIWIWMCCEKNTHPSVHQASSKQDNLPIFISSQKWNYKYAVSWDG